MPNHPHPIDIAELRRLHEAATPGDLTTAEHVTVLDVIECPVCQGDGEVDAKDYCNIDHKALGVQFYGVGHEFGAHEALWSAVMRSLPALLDRIEAEEWRPIETAPKDGTSILAIVAGTHPQTGEPFVPEVVEWDEGDSCWWNCMWGYDNAHSTYNPTHWRHLPAAPTTGGADA